MNRALLPDLPTADTFGAPKRNFEATEDPETSADADDFNALSATAEAVARTAARAWALVSSTGTLLDWDSVWGDTANPPVPLKTGTGVYTVTWPSSVGDLHDGTARAFAPRAAKACANTSGRVAGSARVSGQVVTVETFNTSGMAAADSAFLVEVV